MIQPTYYGSQRLGTYCNEGSSAQEVQKVYPELVKAPKKAYLSIDYMKFTAVLLQAIKELESQKSVMQAQIDALQDQINASQEKIKTLEKQK